MTCCPAPTTAGSVETAVEVDHNIHVSAGESTEGRFADELIAFLSHHVRDGANGIADH